MMKSPSVLYEIVSQIVVPGVGALITGLLAGLLAHAIGWPGVAVGLGVALLAWILRPTPGGLALPEVKEGRKESNIKVTILSEDGRQGDYLHLAIDADRLRKLAEGLTQGRALTTREWTGQSGLLSQSEFARLRSALIFQGLARWNSNRDFRGGCTLTARGKATMRGLSAPPQPNGPRLIRRVE